MMWVELGLRDDLTWFRQSYNSTTVCGFVLAHWHPFTRWLRCMVCERVWITWRTSDKTGLNCHIIWTSGGKSLNTLHWIWCAFGCCFIFFFCFLSLFSSRRMRQTLLQARVFYLMIHMLRWSLFTVPLDITSLYLCLIDNNEPRDNHVQIELQMCAKYILWCKVIYFCNGYQFVSTSTHTHTNKSAYVWSLFLVCLCFCLL